MRAEEEWKGVRAGAKRAAEGVEGDLEDFEAEVSGRHLEGKKAEGISGETEGRAARRKKKRKGADAAAQFKSQVQPPPPQPAAPLASSFLFQPL